MIAPFPKGRGWTRFDTLHFRISAGFPTRTQGLLSNEGK